jgi:hypothetical protein
LQPLHPTDDETEAKMGIAWANAIKWGVPEGALDTEANQELSAEMYNLHEAASGSSLLVCFSLSDHGCECNICQDFYNIKI